jgi:hypothetical protein
MTDQDLLDNYLEFINKLVNHSRYKDYFSIPTRGDIIKIIIALKPINDSWDNRTDYCSHVYIEDKPYDDVYVILGINEGDGDFRKWERLVVFIDNDYSWLKRLKIKGLMD